MSQINTPDQVFEKLSEQFNDSKAQGVNGVIQFDLSGENGGKWAIKITDGACQVIQGGVDAPNTTLLMSDTDFVSMFNGKLNAMAAFMQGKIKLQGDMGMAMKLQTIFGLS